MNSVLKSFEYHIYMLLTFLIIITLFANVDSRRHSPLLIEDDGSRRTNRPAVSECQFGKTLRELGSTWFADLGPPFGVMYCIKCECVAVPKKRRVVARVQCRNIKNECPPTLCDDPVLLPGKCCKTCPGDHEEEDVLQDIPAHANSDDEERSFKHFAALLTGRTSQFLRREEMKSMYSTNNPQNIVVSGRFTFHKKNLYYSFYISSKSTRPRAIQFMNDIGTILEEHTLIPTFNGPISLYQNATGKICGVWRRVPRDYKRLLRDERLYVVLLWGGNYQAELALAGKIAKYTALSTEFFSSVLEPAPNTKLDQMAGAGGTAIVSANSGAASSVHLTVIFNGIFGPEEYFDVPVSIRIEWAEKKDIIIEEIQRVRKPSPEINIIEMSSPISNQNLRLLSRGKLLLTIESRKDSSLRIQGHIITRVTCELFQTLLTPHNYDSKTKTSGLAWMYLNTDGSLVYNIQTDHLNLTEVPEISLIEDSGKRKTVLEDLTQSLNINQAIGTIDKLGPRVLEAFYSGDLAINIAIKNDLSLVRGRLIPRPVADSRDSTEPILLKRVDTNMPAHLMGMAWIAIDNECNLHYEVTVNGFFSNQQVFQIYLEEKPIEALGAPVKRRLLDDFTGPYIEGFVLGIPSAELVKLETSICYLQIYSKDRKELLLKGKLKSSKVPNHCFPLYTDNNVPSVIVPGDHSDSHYIPPETKCFHSGRFYDEAEQWRSKQEACTMCACQYGRVICDPIKCPSVKCTGNEKFVLLDGECCSTCILPRLMVETNNSAERGCRLGDQFHIAGSTWHPYLPPNGFDTCATCACDPLTLEIHCPRISCPPLLCSEKAAYRPDKKACCKICPEVKDILNREKTGNATQNILRDQGTVLKSAEDILAHGGCKAVNSFYENGEEWHPVLASHGEQKCIKCRCKDSQVSCDRKRCTRSVCNTRLAAKRKGFAISESDDCCTSNQCRRARRHHSHRRGPRGREERSTPTQQLPILSRS